MRLTADLIWRQMLDLGKDWNNSNIARRLQVTPEAIRLQIKKHGLKQKWDEFHKLNAKSDPEVKAVLSRVAERMKLEDLDNSVLALEVYNEAIIRIAQKVIKETNSVEIKTVSDLEKLITVLAFALKASAETRCTLVEVMVEARQVLKTVESPCEAGKSTMNVLSLADRVKEKLPRPPAI